MSRSGFHASLLDEPSATVKHARALENLIESRRRGELTLIEYASALNALGVGLGVRRQLLIADIDHEDATCRDCGETNGNHSEECRA